MRSTRPQARDAFTLVELIISLSIAAVVLMAVASLLGLSTKAIPAEDGVQVTSIQGAEFVSKFAADAAIAHEVTETGARAVTFVIPDQDGDASPDTVRYVWSGVVGSALERLVNGSDRLEIVESVSAFDLEYAFDDVPAYAELTKRTDAASTLQTSIVSVATSREVGSTRCGQVFAPTLPSGVIAWTLDELKLSLGPNGAATTTVVVEIRGVDSNNLPTGAVYSRSTVSEGSLGLLGLLPAVRTFTLSGIVVPASEKLCVVVSCTGGDVRASLGTAAGLGWPATAPFLTSTDGGATWNKGTAVVAGHSVSGKLIRVGGGPATRHTVSRVGAALTAGDEAWSLGCGVSRRNPGEAP
ncbi:MAG TPA: prepilin-type N-terminal cleavage/methylation domain-containing protein [Phycisphaerales bacterium]|nr:prepilin-type N-terminal cleavage/methylation domain-containing protein [Phycisphaerales bacterium]